jgi:hypothetical protein
MASEQALAVRRVKAIEEQARQLAEVNRKLDLIMKALKIKEPRDPNEPEVSQATEVSEIE